MYGKRLAMLLLLALAAWCMDCTATNTPGIYIYIWYKKSKKPSYRIIMENERDKMEIFDRQFHYSIWHKSYYYIYSHCSTYTHIPWCVNGYIDIYIIIIILY